MTVEIIIERYKDEIEKALNVWMVKNEYLPVKLEGKVLEGLLDEFLCFLTSNSDMESVMDEIDKDYMLGEYDCFTSIANNED